MEYEWERGEGDNVLKDLEGNTLPSPATLPSPLAYNTCIRVTQFYIWEKTYFPK